MTNVYKNNVNYLCPKIIPTVMLLFLQQGKYAEKMKCKHLHPLGTLVGMLHNPQTWKVYWEK